MRQENSNPIRIGMTMPLTGRYAPQGRQARAGVAAWVADANAAGGVHAGTRRRAVELICHDDRSDPAVCARETRRLIATNKVDLLLGPYSSTLARCAAEVADAAGHVLWNHGGASDVIFRSGLRGVVGILAPASRYFHGVIDCVRQRYPAARCAAVVFADSGSFPRAVADGAETYARTRGFARIARYGYNTGTADFSVMLDEIERLSPALVLGVGRIEDDLRLAEHYAARPPSGASLGLVAAGIQQFGATLGAAAEGVLGPSQWEPAAAGRPDYGPTAEAVLASLRRQRTLPIDYPMVQAYAGCVVAARCVEAAGSVDQEALRQAAGRLRFSTFFGRYEIDPDSGMQTGHVMPVVEWRGGEKRVVWPPDLAP